ncbi:hypothetical protein [Bradyrhizobium embrapense]|uniref:hypothetical protein n=1 Tax=Bradyrhizobium embrapense TaxID=630921 RepID=UPI00067B4786|nr:hypothetical protein [Bradyrhizobium embrapense]
MATATIKKRDHVTYVCSAGVTVTAIVRTAHRDGTATVEARHMLDSAGNIRGCYLGYRYRFDASDLTRVEA